MSFVRCLPLVTVVLMAAVVVTHSHTNPQTDCLPGWTLVGQQCYWINHQPMTYSDAEHECEHTPGARLAHPSTEDVYGDLISWSEFVNISNYDIWLGLHRHSSGGWHWEDGTATPVTWELWFPDCTVTPYDIQFLTDDSGSIGSSRFSVFRDFMELFTQQFTIGPSDTQIGVTTFSTNVDNEFYMNHYHIKAHLLAAISAVPYSGGGTATNLGLDFVRTNVFAGANGDRSGFENILIVLTDGVSNNPTATATAANALHNVSPPVYVFGVGVGSGTNLNELDIIASDPTAVFFAPTFATVTTIVTLLHREICDVNPPTNGNCAYIMAAPVYHWNAANCSDSSTLKRSVCQMDPSSYDNFVCPYRFGYYQVPNDHCHFYQCSNYIAHNMTCPTGTVWSQSQFTCTWPPPGHPPC